MLSFSVTFFFSLLNIVILFVILRKTLFKPISKFMLARTEKIKGEMEQAAKNMEEAKNLRQTYEEKMRRAGDDAMEAARKIRIAAEQRAEEVISAGKAQAESIVESGRNQIEAERRAAYTAFKTEASALVVQAAARLLQREFSGEDAHRRAAALIEELGAKN
jgi:F-type H+-transporting ATPase subunit b